MRFSTSRLLLAVTLTATTPVWAADITGTDDDETFNAHSDPATTDGDDTVQAAGGDDRVDAGEGDDEVHGDGGDDLLYGEEGDDVLHGGNGIDTIRGGDGDDQIDGGEDGDILRGDRGNDLLWGREGDDEIHGHFGEDAIDGGAGDDEIHGGPDNDTVTGGGGADEIHGDNGDDRLHGGDGGDLIRGGANNDWLYGEGGDDDLRGFDGFDYLDGGEGADLLNGDGGEDLILARDGDDSIITGSGDDFIAVVGSSIDGLLIRDNVRLEDGVEVAVDSGTDMLCFVRDVNPDQMTYITLPPHDRTFLEFDTGLPTNEPVTLDLQAAGNLHYIEAVRTGTANDTVRGTDLAGRSSYFSRFLGAENQWIQCDELFFTGEGNDVVETRGGNDLVDLGAGDDLLIAGPGEHTIATGPGRDLVQLDGDAFNGTGPHVEGPGRCRVTDLALGDRVVITGSVTADAITLENHEWDGLDVVVVSANGVAQFDVFGHRVNQLNVTTQDGQVVISPRRRDRAEDEAPDERDREDDRVGGGRRGR